MESQNHNETKEKHQKKMHSRIMHYKYRNAEVLAGFIDEFYLRFPSISNHQERRAKMRQNWQEGIG